MCDKMSQTTDMTSPRSTSLYVPPLLQSAAVSLHPPTVVVVSSLTFTSPEDTDEEHMLVSERRP